MPRAIDDLRPTFRAGDLDARVPDVRYRFLSYLSFHYTNGFFYAFKNTHTHTLSLLSNVLRLTVIGSATFPLTARPYSSSCFSNQWDFTARRRVTNFSEIDLYLFWKLMCISKLINFSKSKYIFFMIYMYCLKNIWYIPNNVWIIKLKLWAKR